MNNYICVITVWAGLGFVYALYTAEEVTSDKQAVYFLVVGGPVIWLAFCFITVAWGLSKIHKWIWQKLS